MDTLFEAVARGAKLNPSAAALADANGTTTYADLHRTVLRVADALRTRGIGRDDVIALQLPNSLPFVVLLLAAGALGAPVQMLHMPYRRAELASLLRHGGASVYVGLTHFKDESPVATVQALDLVRQCFSGEDAPAAEGRAEGRDDNGAAAKGAVVAAAVAADGPPSWTQLVREGSEAAVFTPPDPDSRYVLLHTSGTTADPKCVPVSHRCFIGNAGASLAPLQIGASDVLLAAAPFTHLYGLFVLEMGLLAGACISLMPAFTPPALVTVLERDRVTALFGGPAHVRPLLLLGSAAVASAIGGLRLVCLSGTAVPPELAQATEAILPQGKVIQLWGMSELQAGSYGRPDDPARLRHFTAGRPSPGTHLRIRPEDDGGADCAGTSGNASVEGPVQVRGPSLFSGYLDNPAATAAAFEDGWFNTGDLGYLSADGALVLTGRIKEIINRGGIKFNPLDIEAIIDRLPGVVQSAIVPMPDPVLGERACAFVQADRAVTLDEVKAALDLAGVARFKWPERLEQVAEMPMTPTRKIMRGRLTAMLAAM